MARRRLQLAGHIFPMDRSRIPRIAMHWQPRGAKRPQERPRNTWRRTFIQDLKASNMARDDAEPWSRTETNGDHLLPDMPHSMGAELWMGYAQNYD
uniref:Uncharacterized protein n=1 Tax=Romanomermis culicivorax TaxID=13658 RepID=A0A915IK08_ROMCU